MTIKKDKNSKKIEFSFIKNFFIRNKGHFIFFGFLILLGIFFFSVSLFTNYFTTPFGGDYVSQQFAFYTNGYDDWWHFFKTGEFIFFDTNTYLGANNIGSNSFYYLFDPFFMPILLCPREFIPQGMAFLTIFKIALAGLAFYAYMRKLDVSVNSSRIVSIMYAFSGWITWFLWFNHFTEIAICLPLILLGIEKVLRKERPFVLIFAITLIGFVNYFFMFTLVLCAFIYAIVRLLQRISLNSVSDNFKILGIGALSFVVGLMISSVVFIPATIVALSSSRATSSNYLELIQNAIKNNKWNLVFSYLFSWEKIDGGKEYRSLYPIFEFFFPAMTNRGTPLIKIGNETYDNVAGSLFCYTPCIILLVPALIRSFKEKKYSHLVIFAIFVFALFTPFTYYLMHGFTQPYSRWTLFVSVSLIAYIGVYLDKLKDEPKWVIYIGGLFAVIGITLTAILSNHVANNTDNITPRVPIFLVMVIAIIEVVTVNLLISIFYKKYKFNLVLSSIVVIEAIAMGSFTIFGHGLVPYVNANNGLVNNNALYALTSKVQNQDKGYYRSYSSISGDSAKNDGMRNNYNSAAFYHSIYNYNVNNFIEWSKLVGNQNGWSGTYVEKRLNLDTFLGIKYYYILKEDLDYDRIGVTYRPNIPFDMEDVSSIYPSDKYFVYKKNNYIDFAFSFDSIYAYNSIDNIGGYLNNKNNFATIANEELYLKHGILDYRDVEEIMIEHPTLNNESTSLYPTISDAKLLTDGKYNSNYDFTINYHRVSEGKAKTSSFGTLIDAYKSGSIAKPSENDMKTFISLSSKTNQLFPYDTDGVVFYINLPYKLNHKYDVYLVDENDNLITMDRHSDNYVTNNNSRKQYRAYYLNRTYDERGYKVLAPKLKTILFVPRYKDMYTSYPVAYETYTDFELRKTNELNTFKVEQVRYKTDEFTFLTNFDHERFITTQVAFDTGWKVYATKVDCKEEEVKTYNAQGGFVGFVSKEGYTTYRMVYETPLLQTSKYISGVGILIYFSVVMAYYYIDVEAKKKKIINDLHF